jgi:hypothetical protein
MADRSQAERIRAFIDQHKDQYDRAALRQQLLAAGYDSRAIDDALDASAAPVASNRSARVDFTKVSLGLLLFGPLSLGLWMAGSALGAGVSGAVWFPIAFALVVIGLAALLAFVFQQRGVAIGVLAGYAILSLISGGACTLIDTSGDAIGGLILGFFGYPLLMVGLAIVLFARRLIRR